MTIEGLSAEVGAVRIRDARLAAGRALRLDDVVDALVLVDGVPVQRRLELALKPSGRGQHVRFKCPKCGEPRAVLFADVVGDLGCARCNNTRTRHQKESWTKSWKEHGLELEDRLLRAVLRRGHTPAGLRRLHGLVAEINRGDEDRLAAALSVVSDALRIEADHEQERDGTLGHLLVGMFLKAV